MDVLTIQQGQSDFCKCYSVKFFFKKKKKKNCVEHCLLSFLNYNICVKHYFLFLDIFWSGASWLIKQILRWQTNDFLDL